MKSITKEMIKIYNIDKLGYDFMGYKIHKKESLSFHHLIVPKRDCPKKGLGSGYLLWNGAILVKETAHDYLHTIESIDRDIFLLITEQMIIENKQQQISLEQLRKIREYLLYFEDEYSQAKSKKGDILIKERFKRDRIQL